MGFSRSKIASIFRNYSGSRTCSVNIVEVSIKGLVVDKQSSTRGAWDSPWPLWWHLYVDSRRTHGLGGWIDSVFSEARGWAGMRITTTIMGCNVNALCTCVPLCMYILTLPHVPPYVCINWFVCPYSRFDVISYLGRVKQQTYTGYVSFKCCTIPVYLPGGKHNPTTYLH